MVDFGDKRTVLVVEDNDLNREILTGILEEDYAVLQAENGLIGLETLEKYGGKVSLILLDIQMPVMNGYAFLEKIKEKKQLSHIPIIVTTSSDSMSDEVKCLENGASDFITKPYNPEIVLTRSASMIRLSETSAMLGKVERDSLTGVYSKEFFYYNAEKILESYSEKFDIFCTDIEAFKIINDRYGVKKGDQLLRFLAKRLLADKGPHGICGRISGDVFAILSPHIPFEEYAQKAEKIYDSIKEGPVPNAVICFGVYSNISRDLPISVACDNALLAAARVKHRYGAKIAAYDESVREKLRREKVIQDHMEEALETKQFQVYFQAKHDLQTDKTGGAEALVRWISPELGFMSPGEFIPLFERNGFITKLDFYMMEEICRIMRKWLDAGVSVQPVSVNISRADFERKSLVEELQAIIKRNGLSCDLLHLEVTESAYIDNPSLVIDTIVRMKEAGFLVELDDFGAGYSSLNVLTEVPLDVLKLDMSIIRNMHLEKQHIVLKHMIKMAKSLHMKTVAEGVETVEQANALRSMGCNYAQGYFYCKPVPYREFIRYL